jgi:hypothetical protein
VGESSAAWATVCQLADALGVSLAQLAKAIEREQHR